MKLLLQLLLTAYLGLAPIYWLPGISPELLGPLKIVLFILAIAMTFAYCTQHGRLAMPRGLVGPLGLALCLLSITASILRSEGTTGLTAVKDYLLVFSTLWCFFALSHLRFGVENVLIGAAFIVACACALVVASRYLGIPNFSGPRQYVADHLWMSGFSSLRTGWSNGVALYVAPLMLLLAPQRRSSKLKTSLALIAIGAIVASQFVVAGRAGLLAALIAIAIPLTMRGYRKFLAIGALAAVLLVTANLDSVLSQMRIVREGQGNPNSTDINTISAGRIGGAVLGIQLALEAPLTGHGFREVTLGRDEIHNIWIRLAAESGVLAPLILGAVLFTIFQRLHRIRGKLPQGSPWRYPLTVNLGALYAGLVISMLEPRMLLGTFQISIMWWVLAGTALGARLRPVAKRQHPANALINGSAPCLAMR